MSIKVHIDTGKVWVVFRNIIAEFSKEYKTVVIETLTQHPLGDEFCQAPSYQGISDLPC